TCSFTHHLYSSIKILRIGIISMYRAQLMKLRQAFSTRYGKDALSRIDFNTVDGFQGQEKDIIILSCVRAGPNITTIVDTSYTRNDTMKTSSLNKKEQADGKMEIFTPAALKAFNARRKLELDTSSSISELHEKEHDIPSEVEIHGPLIKQRLASVSSVGEDNEQTGDVTLSSLSRKRALSTSDDIPRPAPTSRPNVSDGNIDHPHKPQPEGSSSKPVRPRPPPKSKAPNLFIPKKPAVRLQ
ncbi:12673_t:CDS:2, partial [Acaulospora colombiana]